MSLLARWRRRRAAKTRAQRRRETIRWALAALTIRWALLDPYAVPSGSMLPSLLIGDRMFVDKTAYGVRVPFTSTWLARWGAPHRGDVVVFADPEHPRRMLVKRVAAVAGDHLRWEDNGLVLNGVPLAQRALPDADPWRADLPVELGEAAIAYAAVVESLGDRPHRMLVGPDTAHAPGEVVVPSGSVFVLGDLCNNAVQASFFDVARIRASCTPQRPAVPLLRPSNREGPF